MQDRDGKHVSSIVWVEKTKDSENFMRLDKKAFEKSLQTRTKGALGEVKLASNPESWPLKAVIADDIVAPRIALIAEAAHAMSPIGAQGLNLSLRDVDTLTEILVNSARLGEDLGSDLVLSRYSKQRYFDIHSRFNGVDGYNRIVSNNIGFLRGLRRAGLKTLNNIPAFKHFAMQHILNPDTDNNYLVSAEKH
jgi:2-octaprenyl-6-methoxyphenol hydroxylase